MPLVAFDGLVLQSARKPDVCTVGTDDRDGAG
jgi:hypothetical protein